MNIEGNPLMVVLIVIIVLFVIGEIAFTLNRARKARKKILEQTKTVAFLGSVLAKKDENEVLGLAPQFRQHAAADYLAACAGNGQMVYSEDFMQLLSLETNRAFGSINSTANTLPIIGLMGTFLGIILGILPFFKKGGTTMDSEAIQSLITSAGLAFSSSFMALACATWLKFAANRWKKQADANLEFTQRKLLVDYLPATTGTHTDDIFSKSVIRLRNTIHGFAASFEGVSKGFIAEFQPLVEGQRKTNEETLKHINLIAGKLEENTASLRQVSEQQGAQVNVISDVSAKLTQASDALQASMQLASENLKNFVALGENMQAEIGSMHKPLQEILGGQSSVVTTMNKLFTDVGNYYLAVQGYTESLNSKLDQFSAVGDKVYEVRQDFGIFSQNLRETLDSITSEARSLQQDIKLSFGDYDRNLKTLFTDVVENRRDVHIAYYDPALMKQVEQLSTANQKLLEQLEKYLGTVDRSTGTLVNIINSLRGWGIYRVKKEKKDNKDRGK
ncbi:MAG: hypothetical protein LHW45_06620 [Candidatus Cloacimonetes bacterium]|jgi:methyl-accepting chemotaxis protein|nr:hypothetical protein [Candidatus Cloacimonadota bacterium]MDY0367284.1 hypothetical protein [Candidatus Syntrophosphaera sp.]HOY85486.1 hypothetical protein [Candidatus Syntrophosphaera sp.]